MITLEIFVMNNETIEVVADQFDTVTGNNDELTLSNCWYEMEGNIAIDYLELVDNYGSFDVLILKNHRSFSGNLYLENSNLAHDVNNTYFLNSQAVIDYFKLDCGGSSVPSPVSSLNGNGSEFRDGEMVNVESRDVVYSVSRSYHTIYADNAYIVVYDLESEYGHKLSAPESMLTRYVEPVTTP